MANRLDTNFFYNIKISTLDGKRSTNLTDSLRKSLVSVTINTCINSETSSGNTAELVFKEQYMSGSNLNPGYLGDLRFEGNDQLGYVSPTELKSSQYIRKGTKIADNVVFLFDNNNAIEITWGYRSPYRARTMAFKIIGITTNGGSSGDGTVKITAADVGYELKKTKPEKGINYSSGGKPESLSQVVFKIGKSRNLAVEFDGVRIESTPPSSNFPLERRYIDGQDVGFKTAAVHPRGLDFDSFLYKLARETFSTYEIDHATENGVTVEVLKFTSHIKRFPKPTRTFTYRNGNGDLLDWSVSSAYSATHSSTSSVDGSTETSENIYVTEQLATAKSSPNDKKSKGVSKSSSDDSKKVLGVGYAGKSITGANAEHADMLARKNNMYQNLQSSITMETVGDPNYKPDLIRVENIGARFSTNYRMVSVSHKLSTSGYTCSWSGLTDLSGESGTDVQEDVKNNETVSFPFIK